MAVTAVLAAACSAASTEDLITPDVTTTSRPATTTTAPRPSTTTTSPPPVTSRPAAQCAPGTEFAWYEGFVRAYNSRNVGRLEELLPFAETFTDPLTAGSGQVTFRDIDSWTAAAWATGDVLTMIGYEGAGRRGIIVQREPQVPDVGTLETAIRFTGDGCTVTGVEVAALIGHRSACVFYTTVPAALAAGVPAPPGCADGSGDRARIQHDTVAAGARLIVLGGSPGSVERTANDGFALLPDGRWQAIPPSPYQTALGSAHWTGDEVLVWGGRPVRLTGYEPGSGAWRLPEQPPDEPVVAGGSVWTGEELVVWGSDLNYIESNALAYAPATGTWREIAPAPVSNRSLHTMVWTGAEVVVWGGTNGTDYADGAAYDPVTDTWRELPPAGIAPRHWHTAVWSGTEMIVYGGTGPIGDRSGGAAYDPAADSWRPLAASPLAGRHWHTATWTGTEMIVYGGYNGSALGDGAAYDPAADAWRLLPAPPLAARCLHTATWTGRDIVVVGGYDGCGNPGLAAFGDGARYDPAQDTWTLLPAGPTEQR